MRRTSEKGAVVSNRGCVARLGNPVMTHDSGGRRYSGGHRTPGRVAVFGSLAGYVEFARHDHPRRTH
jgi:hypothetical protein